MKHKKTVSKGQTLVEIIVVVGVVLVILTVVVNNVLSSLRNSTFSEAKSQATAYAKEGLEIARQQRDAGWYAFVSKGTSEGLSWCVDGSGTWTQGSSCTNKINNTFERILRLTLDSSNHMTVVSTVTWQEGGSTRKSELVTVLTQWR